jgi:hypothetical protein
MSPPPETRAPRHGVLSKLMMRSGLDDITDTLPSRACQPETCRIQPADLSRNRSLAGRSTDMSGSQWG